MVKISLMNSIFFLVGILLTSCAVYHTKPLPATSDLLQVLPAGQKNYTIDQVVALAVLNNPDLKLARDDAAIAQAQVFAAGLLPDPQFNFGRDFPIGNQPGAFTAVTYGLNYDTTAFITRFFAKKEANAQEKKIDLTLLWQEWQVASQAQLLTLKIIEQNRLLLVMKESRQLSEKHYLQVQQALQTGDMTLDVVDTELSGVDNADKQITELQRQINQTHHDLNELLGLSFDVEVPLAQQLNVLPLNNKKILQSLNTLLNQRPDLLALKAGYQSEDARYRQAVWAQFPAITLGPTRSKDTSNVRTAGFTLSLNLPLFNRNQGNIAIEKATRQRLYDEFQSRLNSAESEIRSLMADQDLFENELTAAYQTLTVLQKAVRHAKIAYKNGDIDELTYRTFQIDFLNKKADTIILEQNVLAQRINLQTLLGRELPVKTT
jgi:outer membrane protein TolC